MIKIESTKNKKSMINLLDNAMITFSFSTINALGFIGQVNREASTFWMANQSRIYSTRTGTRFKTFRRLEGSILDRGDQRILEGKFSIRPLFKIVITFYMLIFISLGILGGVFTITWMNKVKIITTALLMIIAGFFVIQFKLKQTQTSEVELVRFLEELFNEA